MASALSLGVGGCASLYEGEVGYVEGFFGGVVADEPRAALAGRDVLSSGGSAADAATAMYFTLAVTMPGAAGLGGGGVCLVHDAESKTTQSLEFLPGVPSSGQRGAGDRPGAIPGSPRGIFALHAKYGRLRWETLVSPAENMARFGLPVSRAFAADLIGVGNALLSDASMRAVFANDAGRVLAEGEKLRQVDLAASLGILRSKGPGDFYVGRMAKRIVEAYGAVGSTLTVADLRAYSPRWTETVKRKRGNEVVHFPSQPSAAAVSAVLWQSIEGDDRFQDAKNGGKARVLAEASRQAFTETGAGARMGNPSATSFVAVDRDGSAVACAVTLNAPFGTGRIARGVGIIPAALAGAGGRGPDALSVMMVLNPHVNEFHFAAGASGGIAAPTAMANVAAHALIDNALLSNAMTASRVHHGGAPDQAYFEQGLDTASVQALGAGAQAVDTLGRVNAVHCPKGIPPNPENCAALADPRGAGLGQMSEDE